MFTVAASGTTRAPFLMDMARDLSTSMPLVADLVAATSISWGVTAMLAGAGSDRWGTPAVPDWRPAGLGLHPDRHRDCAPTFLLVASWSDPAGGCSGMFTGVCSPRSPTALPRVQQGRALGWVMSGQSLTLAGRRAAGGGLGSMIGWRGVNLCVGALALSPCRPVGDHARGPGRDARASDAGAVDACGPVVAGAASAAMGVAERVCYGLTVVYFATFLQPTYLVRLDAVASAAGVFALGNILGTLLGGPTRGPTVQSPDDLCRRQC